MTTTRRPRGDARTRKSRETRERIMEAAAGLMSERGATDFQMSEVSERCGMSKGSLYYYFSDRSELVQAIFDRSVDELVARVEREVAQAPSAAESLREVMAALAEGVWMGSALTLAMTRELVAGQDDLLPRVEGGLARIVQVVAAQLERAKVEGLVRDGVDCRMTAGALAGAFVFIMLDRSSGAGPGPAPAGRAEDVGRLVDAMLDLALTGAGTERGRELFARAAAVPGTPGLPPSRPRRD